MSLLWQARVMMMICIVALDQHIWPREFPRPGPRNHRLGLRIRSRGGRVYGRNYERRGGWKREAG